MQPKPMKERKMAKRTDFAFNVDLLAVMRVKAENEAEARAKIVAALNIGDVEGSFHYAVRITEAHLDGDAIDLFEIDGKEIENEGAV